MVNQTKENIRILQDLKSTGLTGEPISIPLITDEPKIPSFTCVPKTELERRGLFIDDYGQGFDMSSVVAQIKAVGECLERLCLFNPYRIQEPQDVGKVVDPELFCAYSHEQVNREKFISQARKEKYKVIKVRNLKDNSETFLPAQLVYLSSQFDDEFPIRKERISTGAACGPHGEDTALRKGFFEVVERDAWISSHLTERKIKRIRGLPDDLKELVEYLKRYRLETYIFDITTDVDIPTVTCVTLDRTGIGDAMNLGAKADSNYHDAVQGAIMESIQHRRGSRIDRAKNPQVEEKIDIANIETVEQRYLYCRPLSRIEYLNQWIGNNTEIEYNTLSEKDTSLKASTQTILNKGYDVFIADITLPEIRTAGFEVLKVLIPQLHPLYLSERAKALYSVHHGSIKDNPQLKPHMFT